MTSLVPFIFIISPVSSKLSVLFDYHDFPPFCQILEAITATINTLRAETRGIYNLVSKFSLTNFSLEMECFQWLDLVRTRLEFYKRFNPILQKATFLSSFRIVRFVKRTINNSFDVHVCNLRHIGGITSCPVD